MGILVMALVFGMTVVGCAHSRGTRAPKSFQKGSRTQLIIKAEAEYLDDDKWVQGFDTRAIETLRNDLNNVVGN